MNIKALSIPLLVITSLSLYVTPSGANHRSNHRSRGTYQVCEERLAPGTYFPERSGVNVSRTCRDVPIDDNTIFEEVKETDCTTNMETGLPDCKDIIRRVPRGQRTPRQTRPKR